MDKDHEEVWHSRSAKEIKAYCVAMAKELGLTLEDIPCWGYTPFSDMPWGPYSLILSIVRPFKADVPLSFTRDEVLGYADSTTKAAIENEIRHELESLTASREQSCIHGQS